MDRNGELVDNPLFVAGVKALEVAGNAARTIGDKIVAFKRLIEKTNEFKIIGTYLQMMNGVQGKRLTPNEEEMLESLLSDLLGRVTSWPIQERKDALEKKAVRLTGEIAEYREKLEYGVLVCFAFAAAGMNALIAKVQTIDAISTGSQIWWLRETYDKGGFSSSATASGHEYLAITRPGVAMDYLTAEEELFGDDDTIIVDYWRAQPRPPHS